MTNETGKLAAALAKAQGQMQGAKKDADNPFFKSKYADLASVWEACRKALSDNELSVAQLCDIGADGQIMLNTILMHSSGEKLSGSMPVMIGEKATAQQLGSAITYARRYALSAMVGVAPEDDDGNAASQTETPVRKWAKSKPGETDQVKADVTEFVRKLEMCETIGELNRLVESSEPLIKKINDILPAEWLKRTHDKILQCKEAFELAAE